MTDNNKEQKKTASEKISNFLAKYRFFLIGIIVACIVVAIVLGIVLTVMDSSKEKALSQLDKIVYSLTQVSAEELPAAQDKALDDILALTQGKGGKVAKVRGNMAATEIYFSRQQWQEACDAWLNAALADEKPILQLFAISTQLLHMKSLEIQKLHLLTMKKYFRIQNVCLFQEQFLALDE